jgi:hypothetical protein
MQDKLTGLGAQVAGRTRDPGHAVTYARLSDRHKPVSQRRELVTKGLATSCSTCGGRWPCEVGQALLIIAALARA